MHQFLRTCRTHISLHHIYGQCCTTRLIWQFMPLFYGQPSGTRLGHLIVVAVLHFTIAITAPNEHMYLGADACSEPMRSQEEPQSPCAGQCNESRTLSDWDVDEVMDVRNRRGSHDVFEPTMTTGTSHGRL